MSSQKCLLETTPRPPSRKEHLGCCEPLKERAASPGPNSRKLELPGFHQQEAV